MNDIVKTIDVKEMGMRFKLIRQKLGITQTNLAEQLGTSQVMIYRIEKGGLKGCYITDQCDMIQIGKSTLINDPVFGFRWKET